jgi:hypothetical protein
MLCFQGQNLERTLMMSEIESSSKELFGLLVAFFSIAIFEVQMH